VILHVDANEVTRSAVGQILRQAGFAVREAASGQEALHLAADQPSLTLLDVKLPDISGIEVCRQLKTNPVTAHIPVLLRSAVFTQSQDKVQGLESGADGYVVEPVDPQELVATVRALLRRQGQPLPQPRTELNVSQDLLQASEVHLRLLVEAVTDYAIFLLDPQGQVSSWNRGAERMKGYRADEILGQHFSCFYTREDRALEKPAYELQVAAAAGRIEDEGWRVRKDGSRFWANVVITALRDETGQLLGFGKVTRDLTARRQAEEGLRQAHAEVVQRVAERTAELVQANEHLRQEAAKRQRAEESERVQREYFQTTLASIGDAVIVTDPSGAVTYMNHVAQTLTGWPLEEVKGKALPDVFVIMNEETRQPVENPVGKVLRTGAAVGLGNHTVLRTKAGGELPIDDSAAPIRDAAGRLYGIVLVFREIIARRRAERALAQQTAELQQFAYTVSHDLQEPLRTMINSLHLLARHPQSQLDATAKEYIALVVDGAQHVQRLIGNLLAYTQAGNTASTFTAVKCEAVVVRILQDLQAAITDSGAVITYEPLPTVRGDEQQLGLVFQNLLSNALKFRGPQPPRIHLAVRQDGQYWVFSVRDNGIGLDPRHAERIFDVFQRLHAAEEHQGRGMSLAICKKIIERHGGRIWVESEPGTGTTFLFTLSAL
jgi:PAS domain S-box-containing protein